MNHLNDERVLSEVFNVLAKRKRYSSFSKETIESVFFDVVRKNPKLYEKVLNVKNLERSKVFKEFVSLIKAKLYKKSVMYVKDKGTHISSLERGSLPDFVIEFLREHKIKRIIDLGCGLNPIYFPFNEIKVNYYFACDLREDIVSAVNDFFLKNQINGEAVQMDFLAKLDELPKANVAFLFKVLDLIEDKGHKHAEELIVSLAVKHLIVSFPLKTLSGKYMRFHRRTWLEKMLSRLSFDFYYKKTKNEIFYFIAKA